MRKVDIRDEKQVSDVINDFKPTFVIHSAAERRPDVVEKDEAATEILNVTATGNIARIVKEQGGSLLHISSDYVFDGTKPPYKPSDEPNPLNKYGKSKLAAERVVVENFPSALILRLPVLYGKVESLDESSVTVLFKAVQNSSKQAMMSDYELRYPTDVADVAFVCRQLAERRVTDPSIKGVFHWSGADSMTKYQMAMAMAELFKLSSSHLVADKEPSKGAPRPYNSQLDSSDLEQMGIGRKTAFTEGIVRALKNFVSK